MKKWEVIEKLAPSPKRLWRVGDKTEDILYLLLKNRGIKTRKDIELFLHPPDPSALTERAVGIDKSSLSSAIKRIHKAIEDKESIVVYSDYDADGITAGAVMWETLHSLGAHVMPYIPHRVEEGYGLSIKGIDAVREQYDPSLIITVDHGITAWEKVKYAREQGIDVIVTDHHVKPKKLPDCTIVHTTKLSGAGVSWFLAKSLRSTLRSTPGVEAEELVALAAIGTIADMVPLVGPNRSIATYGLEAINSTKRVGLNSLISDAALTKGSLGTYEVSHILAPRLNAVGRLEHALDALRLLCTKQKDKADRIAKKLGFTNRERQQLTMETTMHVIESVKRSFGKTRDGQASSVKKKLLFVAHGSYNQGVIGLVAGKLVEEYYRPAIVVSKGEVYSKASARSINGFNIVEAVRACSDILVDVGGHPMAAGFTVETKHLAALQERLEKLAEKELDEGTLTRTLKIDAEIPFDLITPELYQSIQQLQPFGFGNPEPVFATRNVKVSEARLVGADGKHLKLRVSSPPIEAIAFNLGSLYSQLQQNAQVDLAYTISLDTWNGSRRLQLKIKDIHLVTQ